MASPPGKSRSASLVAQKHDAALLGIVEHVQEAATRRRIHPSHLFERRCDALHVRRRPAMLGLERDAPAAVRGTRHLDVAAERRLQQREIVFGQPDVSTLRKALV
jgi:hypothetical protein